MSVTKLLVILIIIGGVGFFVWKGGYIGKMKADSEKTFSYHYSKAQTDYQMSKYDDAIKEFEAALAIDPKDTEAPVAMMKIGDCYKEKKDDAKAVEYYQRCLKDYPDFKLRGRLEQSIEKIKPNK